MDNRSRYEQSETSWEEAVAVGIELREQRDALSFGLGDMALAVCGGRNPDGGRPGKETHTLSEYARAIREDRARLSGLVANSEFWPPAERAELPPNISWYHLSEARRRSGWRPGYEITAGQKSFALRIVNEYAEEPGAKRPTDPRPAWARKLARAATLIGEVDADLDAPTMVRVALGAILKRIKSLYETIEKNMENHVEQARPAQTRPQRREA